MTEIKLPQAGQSMEDGTIVRWMKKEGETVAKGEVLLEIETDKATVEVEAEQGGTLLKIVVGEGQTVPVLTVIGYLGQPGEDVSAAPAAAAAPAPAASATPAAPKTAAAPTNVIPVLMPQAGQSMEEGTIVKWRVKPGDVIAKGDIIFEVETDKSVVEVEATDAGRLAKIVAGEGETRTVLTPVAYLADNDADVDALLAASGDAPASMAPATATAAPVAAAPVATAAVAAATGTTDSGRVKASPAAKKIAAERGVDLATVATGTGPGGRILSTDVPAVGTASATPAAAPTTFAPVAPASVVAGQATRKPMSGMRKAIARNLLASKQNIPHFYIRTTIDAAPMMDFYRGEKAKYRCSVNDVVILACAKALQEFPAMRSRIDGNDLLEFANSNIGMAVGIEGGLVVPVLEGAEQMTLAQIGSRTRQLADNARSGKIEGMGKGVFTISNMGMFGIEEFTAIINPPEAAILAVGATRETVIVSGGTMRPGLVMTMTLSCDHRVVDGALAAKFMNRLKELLEWPQQMMK
jgi:pyruvate dehydrogenase E2 component (dihydrolipoamide acetyltransferase)